MHIRFVTLILFIVSLGLSGCQTLNHELDSKEHSSDQLLNSKLALISDLLDQGKARKAWFFVRPLIKEYPSDHKVLNIAGLTFLALSQATKASNFFAKAYELNNNQAYALNLSSSYIARKNFAEARKVLAGMLNSKIPYAYRERIYHNMGLTYDQEKNYKQALRYYSKALSDNPTFYMSHMNLARIYLKLKETPKSYFHYEKAIEYCPNCFEATSEYSQKLLKGGQFEQAQATIKRFLSNKDLSESDQKRALNLLALVRESVKTKTDQTLTKVSP